MRKLTLLRVSLILFIILPFVRINYVGASGLGNMTYNNVPNSVELGKNFTFQFSYSNQTGSDQYIGNCSLSYGFGDGRTQSENMHSISFQGVTLTTSAGYNKVGASGQDWGGGGVFGNIPFSFRDNGDNILVPNGGNYTFSITAKTGTGVTSGDTLLLLVSGSGCAVVDGPDNYNVEGTVSATVVRSINVTSAATPTPTQVATPTPTEEPSEDDLTKIILPSVFDGNTTDLEDLKNLEDVDDFTLETSEFGKIEFLETLNLSDENLINSFEDLDEFVKIDKGSIFVDSEEIREFNAKARITFRDMNLIEGLFDIYKDDEKFTDQVDELRYNSQSRTVSFEVDGFSEYSIGSKLELEKDNLDSQVEDGKLTLKGRVGDLDGEVKIFVNDDELNEEIEVKADGTFEQELTLIEGDNEIRVSVKSPSEQEISETITVKNGEAKQPNIFTILIIITIVLIILGLIAGIIEWRSKGISKFLKKLRNKKEDSALTSNVEAEQEEVEEKVNNGEMSANQETVTPEAEQTVSLEKNYDVTPETSISEASDDKLTSSETADETPKKPSQGFESDQLQK